MDISLAASDEPEETVPTSKKIQKAQKKILKQNNQLHSKKVLMKKRRTQCN